MTARAYKSISILLTLVLAACATVDFDYPRESSTSIPAPDNSRLANAVTQHTAPHPGESGFYPLVAGIDALAARLLLAEGAESSIDAQYFLIHDDVVGRAFLWALIRAADRGVRVRLLVDDIHTDGYDAVLATIDAHPNIEIRLFNPFAHRGIRAFDMPGNLRRVLRRMHNKSFIIDNSIAVLGGRNIGDEYFDAGEKSKFADLDVAAIGPVVTEVAGMFDLYWNHRYALPMPAIRKQPESVGEDLEILKANLRDSNAEIAGSEYATAVRSSIADILERDSDIYYWAPARFVYDAPEKSQSGRISVAESTADEIRLALREAREELLVITPYFVLTDEEVTGFGELKSRGIDITVVTNSLASNNHVVSHSGYASIRKSILRHGIALHELRADATVAGDERRGDNEASATLHSKAFVIDRKTVFIGSFNWNQRSINVDTEMGVVIESSELGELFSLGIQGVIDERTWAVSLNADGKLRWTGTDDGQAVVYTREPQSGLFKRIGASLMRIFPIKNQL